MDKLTAREVYGDAIARQVAEPWEVVKNDLLQVSRRRAEEALTAIYMRAEALVLADALSGQPLDDARAAAAPLQLVVEQATAALKEAQKSCEGRPFTPIQASVAGAAGDVPSGGDPDVAAAQRALWDAKQAAHDSLLHLRQLEAKIAALRATPGPELGDLAILRAALCDHADIGSSR